MSMTNEEIEKQAAWARWTIDDHEHDGGPEDQDVTIARALLQLHARNADLEARLAAEAGHVWGYACLVSYEKNVAGERPTKFREREDYVKAVLAEREKGGKA